MLGVDDPQKQSRSLKKTTAIRMVDLFRVGHIAEREVCLFPVDSDFFSCSSGRNVALVEDASYGNTFFHRACLGTRILHGSGRKQYLRRAEAQSSISPDLVFFAYVSSSY